MSYIWSGGSEVDNTSAGASSISGYMSGYLIATDEYVTPEIPFARIFRPYGSNVEIEDITVMSGGIMYANNGYLHDVKVYSRADVRISNAQTSASDIIVSGGNAALTLRTLTAENITVSYGGTIKVEYGAKITNLNLLAGANATVSGTVNQAITLSNVVVSGAPVVSSGSVLSAYTTATLTLRNNVSANEVYVHSGGRINVSSGAIVTNLHGVGNTNGKTSPDQMMALIEVSNGGRVSGGEAVQLTRAIVRTGGVLEDMTFNASTHIYVMGGALISGATIRTPNFEVRGGTVRDTVVESGGKLNFTRVANGQTVNVTVGSRGSAYIVSGGTMTNTLVSGGAGTAIMHVSSGAAVSTTLVSNATMHVSKLAWYTPAVTGTVISDGGRMNVSGAVASNTTLNEGGKLYVYNSGSVISATVNKMGYLYLSAGGTATDIVENGGFALGQNGTTLTFVANSFSDMALSSAATLHTVTTATDISIAGNNGTVMSCIFFGGTATNIAASSGGIIFVNSGNISNATVHSGGYINLVENTKSATFVNGLSIESGANMTMRVGDVKNVTVSGAELSTDNIVTKTAYAEIFGGTIDGLNVYGSTGFYGSNNVHAEATSRVAAVVSGAALVKNVLIADAGYIAISSGAVLSNVSMSKGTNISAYCLVNGVSSSMNTRLTIYSGGTAINVSTFGAGQNEVFVQNGGLLSNIDFNSKGFFGAYAGGTLKDGVASGYGASLQGRGGTISGVTVRDRADMWVSQGTVYGNNFISGGYLRLGRNGTAATASNTYVSGGYGTAYQSAVVSSGTTYTKWRYTSTANGMVSSGGVLKDSLIGDTAIVTVRSNGVASDVSVLGLDSYDNDTQDQMLMARLYVSGGAVWSGGDTLKHVQCIVYSGGSVEGVTMGSGGHVYISAGVTARDMVVDGATDFDIRGGVAENTLVKSGIIRTRNGGTLSCTTLVGGSMRLYSAADTASDTIVKGSGVLFGSIGTYTDTTAQDGGFVSAFGGTYNGVTLASGGSMTFVASGATLTGLTADDDAAFTLDMIRVDTNAAAKIDSLENVGFMDVRNTNFGYVYNLAETGNANLVVRTWQQGFGVNTAAGTTTINPFGKQATLDADGKTLTISSYSLTATTTAADLATGGTTINSGDRAMKWSGVTMAAGDTLTFADAAINGDAWLELSGVKAAGTTLYGAAGNFGGTVNYFIHGANGAFGNFAAGAAAGGTVGGVGLVASSADLGLTYLGGFGNVTGQVSATISSGATLSKDFYAGALANYAKTGSATSVGSINATIRMETGTNQVKGNIYGASAVKVGTLSTSVTAPIHQVGDVSITLAGGTATDSKFCLFAGGYATGTDSEKTAAVYTVDSVTATVSGGSWGSANGGRGIFGGTFASGVKAEVGDINLTVSGGTMGNVYGGGWSQKDGVSVVGDVNLSITGGTVANVFGGGTHSTSGGATEAGNVTITVSGGTISGNIYARGQLADDTVKGAEVIFTGGKNFSCGVYGYSYVGGDDSDATLSFSGYTGTFSGKVGGFKNITFAGNDEAKFTAQADDIINTAWIFDTTERYNALAKTAVLDWNAADFAGDTIELKLDSDSTMGWTLVSGADAAAYGTAEFLVSVDGGTAVSLTFDADTGRTDAIADGTFKNFGFAVEDSVLKFTKLA